MLIWKLTAKDELALDRYEGFPNFYRKEFFEYKHGGETDIAMAYIMNGRSPLSAPTSTYYNGIVEGYKELGFDKNVLENAYQHAVDAEQAMRQDNSFLDLNQMKLW